MIEIVGSALYQWDVDRSVDADVDGINIDHIHLSNPGDAYAAVKEGSTVTIPNYLLQSGKPVVAYAVKDGVTVESKTFPVHKRERPADYVYEEDRRDFIYELISDAETATHRANEAAERANEAADKASEYSGDVESIKNELDNLRYDYEGNEYESAGEAVRGADITLNTRIQEVTDLAYTNAVEISILQETVENINPGGGGGITDEEFAAKVTEIIVTDMDEAGSISEAIGNAAANEATWVSEMMMEQHDLLLWDEENGEYIRKVPTYEEVDARIGSIETALDSIIAIQTQLIGGDNV